MTSHWTAHDIPSLVGRTAVVTGGNSGLGLVTAVELARHGANVTIAVRDLAKGASAQAQILAQAPGANVTVAHLDLADLDSITAFAETVAMLDILVNNAGVMAMPQRRTKDGFEMQFGTNHLGHFALTGLVLPALTARPGSRIVTVASNAHKFGRMNFNDLMNEQKYRPWSVYGQSKLANLLFTLELTRRLAVADVPTTAYAAHPGYAASNLGTKGSALQTKLIGIGNRFIAQSTEMGALPTLFAATAAGLPPGAYIGPDGFNEQRGHPKIVTPAAKAQNYADAARLWEISSELTGVRYPI